MLALHTTPNHRRAQVRHRTRFMQCRHPQKTASHAVPGYVPALQQACLIHKLNCGTCPLRSRLASSRSNSSCSMLIS